MGLRITPTGAAWLGSWLLLSTLIATKGNPGLLLMGFGEEEKTRNITIPPGDEGSEYAKAKMRARDIRGKGAQVRGNTALLFFAGVIVLLIAWRDFIPTYLIPRG